MVGTSAARVLRMLATDRLQAAKTATCGENVHVVPRVYGRVGYDVPVAQSTAFRLKTYGLWSDGVPVAAAGNAPTYLDA